MHLLKYKDLCNLVEKITELKKYVLPVARAPERQ